MPVPDRRSNASRASVAYGGLPVFNNNRHLPDPSGILQHFFQFCVVGLDIEIIRTAPESRNGLLSKWSTSLSENQYFISHETPRVENLFLFFPDFYGYFRAHL